MPARLAPLYAVPMIPRPPHRASPPPGPARGVSSRSAVGPAPWLDYFTPFCYSPHGTSATAERSRRLCALVKGGHPDAVALCVQRLVALIARGGAPEFLSREPFSLVPIPRHRPCREPSSGSPPLAVCERLLARGVGARLWPALGRRSALAKSAHARPGSRPPLREHCDSLELLETHPPTRRLLLVDDVITRGRTLLSAAAVLHAELGAQPCAVAGEEPCVKAGEGRGAALRTHLHGVEVFGLALLRTEGLVKDIAAIGAPVHGRVLLIDGDAWRVP
jgi:hypothetical protein